jgi:nucleotide-binding universal stress UspA family protein
MSTPTAPIVVGVDGSPASVDALRWALTQAELTSASVEAIAAWQTPSQYGFEVYSAEVDWADLAEQTLKTALKDAADGGTVDVTSVAVQGHPAQVLVDASARAQLLVVGSRGHGRLAGMLLGSVSEYVIAHADCPVLVIRSQQPTGGPTP